MSKIFEDFDGNVLAGLGVTGFPDDTVGSLGQFLDFEVFLIEVVVVLVVGY
jgi:hypothetical protein